MEQMIKYGVNFKMSLMIFLFLTMATINTKAQSAEVKQLLLNVEKLSQLKNILEDMKKGYSIVSKGYNTIKDISQGNFSLHETFIDGLMLVNPEIRKYKRVADIISFQKNIVSEYSSAWNRFKISGHFNVGEIRYLERVYQQLFNQSVDNLDELTMVITSSKLRMSDDERLKAIDRIFMDTQDKLLFLRTFNQQTQMLSLQRKKETADLKATRQLYNLN